MRSIAISLKVEGTPERLYVKSLDKSLVEFTGKYLSSENDKKPKEFDIKVKIWGYKGDEFIDNVSVNDNLIVIGNLETESREVDGEWKKTIYIVLFNYQKLASCNVKVNERERESVLSQIGEPGDLDDIPF